MLAGMTPCSTCHQKNQNRYLDALKRLERFLLRTETDRETKRNEAEERGIRDALMMGNHEHCRYGLSCPALLESNVRANRLAERLAPVIVSYLESGGNKQELLEHIRGDLSGAYHSIERYPVEREG